MSVVSPDPLGHLVLRDLFEARHKVLAESNDEAAYAMLPRDFPKYEIVMGIPVYYGDVEEPTVVGKRDAAWMNRVSDLYLERWKLFHGPKDQT